MKNQVIEAANPELLEVNLNLFEAGYQLTEDLDLDLISGLQLPYLRHERARRCPLFICLLHGLGAFAVVSN